MIDAWLRARFGEGPLADYLTATVAGIGELVKAFPAKKQVLTRNGAQGPGGELPHVYNREVLASRWGSRQPQLKFHDDIFPGGESSRPPNINRLVEETLATAENFPESQVSRHVILNIEDPANWDSTDAVHLKVFPAHIQKRIDLIETLRARLPGFLLGYWNDVPVSTSGYLNPDNGVGRKWITDAWKAQRRLIEAVGLCTPHFYVEPFPSPVPGYDNAFTAAQTAFAIDQCIQVVRAASPRTLVFPCLWPERAHLWTLQPAPDTPQQVLVRRMPADYFRTILEPCFTQGDGVLLWLYQRIPAFAAGPFVTWDWSAEWIGVLEEYLLNYGVLPWEGITPQKGTA
jgi:hypothetical protein